MRKYPLREQKASFVVPIRIKERTKSGQQRPLPDIGESKQPSTSVRRYQVHVMHEPIMTEPPRRLVRRPSYRLPLPLWVIVGMSLMLALILSLGNVPTHFQNMTEQWNYGNPRTFHIDAHVGHEDSMTPSHFIALNLRREVTIIEFPGSQAEHALVYVGPQLSGVDAEHAPVTLSFRDVSGDDKPDMLVVVRGMVICVFVNDAIKGVPQFRPVKPGESISI